MVLRETLCSTERVSVCTLAPTSLHFVLADVVFDTATVLYTTAIAVYLYKIVPCWSFILHRQLSWLLTHGKTSTLLAIKRSL